MVNKAILLSCCLIMAVAITAGTTAQQLNPDSTQTSLNTCYQAILDAYNAGVDTTSQIEQLNQALNLTSQARLVANTDPQLSRELSSQIQILTENVTQQATTAKEAASTAIPIIPIATITAVLTVGIVVYLLGPEYYGWRGLRLEKNTKSRYKVARQMIKPSL
jgi:lipid II:glycine glycyltransferase (peptidoglycan interpeptide bridge formation enzyme)